jgi:hypothetical protein
VLAVPALFRYFETAAAELGCVASFVALLPGLGATGTVPAGTVILARTAPRKAAQWVRDHYDPAAVETPEQADWLLWRAGHLSSDRLVGAETVFDLRSRGEAGTLSNSMGASQRTRCDMGIGGDA